MATITSPASAATAGTLTTTSSVLVDPLNPAGNVVLAGVIDSKTSSRTRAQASHAVLGRTDVITTSDVNANPAGSLTFYAPDDAAYNQLHALLTSGHVLWLSRADGEAFYFSVASDPRGMGMYASVVSTKLSGLVGVPDRSAQVSYVVKPRP